MADAILTVVLQQITTILSDKAVKEMGMLGDREDALKNLETYLKSIRSVLKDAEELQITDDAIKLLLEDLKIVIYEIEDVLNDWSCKVQKADSVLAKVISLFDFCKDRSIFFRIKKICEKLSPFELKNKLDLGKSKIISPLRNKESTSYCDLSKIIGRNGIKTELVLRLVDEQATQTISIVGMGGIGKTDLARLIYNDEHLKTRFDKMIWLCVSNLFDKKKVARNIILAFEEDNFSFPVYLQDSVTLDFLLGNLKQKIIDRRFFLVLDDVWADDNGDWEDLQAVLKHGKIGSKILVTTRKVSVAKILSSNSALIYHLSSLPEEDCWSVLKQFAFVGKDQLSQQNGETLECIGKRISKKSKGLPLVAKELGQHLQRSESGLWNNISYKELCNLAVWERVVHSLFLSFHDLPQSRIRDCFLYCVTFPKGLLIRIDNLIRHWIGHGYLTPSGNVEREDVVEATGREFFQHLVSCSLFQDFVEEDDAGIVACKMHDIIHDILRYLTRKDFVMKEVNGSENTKLQVPCNDARHLTIMLESHFPSSIKGGSNLRSLLIFSASETRVVPDNSLRLLFGQSLRLRVLDLGMNNSCDDLLHKISSKIGDLIHLRHLNLFGCKMIQRLPDTICQLHDLLSLDLNGCSRLEKLPDGMGNLINLRYLCTTDCFGLSYYPKGIEKLTSLRTLTDIIARADCDDPKVFCIGDLENLNNLHEILRLKLVGNVIDVQQVDKAKFQNKTHLKKIKIYLDGRIDHVAAYTTLNLPLSMRDGFFNDNEW
ncbi:Disease resistance protein [Gossypium australe]|uniref:Disease resistance protein n=1 Tax=Gossypium australe TaxID=47621 RepID=A0A5B6VTM4_9ROSI|nr:Disease resistance protein [Gossypium australe]